jgi:hypothetical protein
MIVQSIAVSCRSSTLITFIVFNCCSFDKVSHCACENLLHRHRIIIVIILICNAYRGAIFTSATAGVCKTLPIITILLHQRTNNTIKLWLQLLQNLKLAIQNLKLKTLFLATAKQTVKVLCRCNHVTIRL